MRTTHRASEPSSPVAVPAGVLPARPPRRSLGSSAASAGSASRGVLAGACLVAAAAHVPVTGEHLDEALYIGLLFIALEVVSVALAVAVLLRPRRAVLATTAVVGTLAVAALVVSRTIGLPLIQEDVGNWAEPLAVVSVVAEAVMVIGGAVAARTPASPSHRSTRVALVVGLGVLAIGLAATTVAAAAETEGSDRMPGTEMPGMDMDGMHMGAPAPSGVAVSDVGGSTRA